MASEAPVRRPERPARGAMHTYGLTREKRCHTYGWGFRPSPDARRNHRLRPLLPRALPGGTDEMAGPTGGFTLKRKEKSACLTPLSRLNYPEFHLLPQLKPRRLVA
ncbi:hypothetical protein GCM10017667_23840 [Streptomyces filamentosus]|uniref:Uncharacterized protein n=1 Tax=Streptomyces filamentosus TaxID=67294 RepID=A0A919EKX0_STRFL|nr:hypothetical protein GCM10017667_23840 [Streptomyces filamentosus]